MNISQNDFQKHWKNLFDDIEKLNIYTSNKTVELKNVTASGYDLEGAVFNGAIFNAVEWENITAEHSKYRDTKFINCKFINCKFWFAEFIDVTFENCEFTNSTFLKSKVINTRIINCKADESEFDGLEGTELRIKTSVFKNRSSFTDSKIPFNFLDTNLSGVNMMGITGMVPLKIEGGVLSEVNFGKSHFSEVVFLRVKQGEGPTRFNSAIAESLTFDDVDMTRGVSLAHVKAKLVRVIGGRFGAAFEGSTIAKVVVRDSFLANIDFSEAQMPFVEIGQSELYDLALWEGQITDLSITNSQINILDATDFKADTVVWDNVTLDGKIDLTNAQVKDFRPTRLKRGPKLQLITTGSNLKF